MDRFGVVSIEQNVSESLIHFEIRNFSEMLQKICVGQFVKSCHFVLNFPRSIGLSTWAVILFPHGQYDFEGKHDKRVSVYLNLIGCEVQSVDIKLDVNIQLGQVHANKKDQILCFDDMKKRWFGMHFSNFDETDRIACGSTSLLSVYIKEHFAVPSIVGCTFQNVRTNLISTYDTVIKTIYLRNSIFYRTKP